MLWYIQTSWTWQTSLSWPRRPWHRLVFCRAGTQTHTHPNTCTWSEVISSKSGICPSKGNCFYSYSCFSFIFENLSEEISIPKLDKSVFACRNQNTISFEVSYYGYCSLLTSVIVRPLPLCHPPTVLCVLNSSRLQPIKFECFGCVSRLVHPRWNIFSCSGFQPCSNIFATIKTAKVNGAMVVVLKALTNCVFNILQRAAWFSIYNAVSLKKFFSPEPFLQKKIKLLKSVYSQLT